MGNPFLDIAFDIHWSLLKTKFVSSGIEEALMEAQNNIDDISKQDKKQITFESSFLALEKATESVDLAWGVVSHLDSVCNSPALRKVYNELLPRVSEFFAQIPLNDELWVVLKTFSQCNEEKKLNDLEKRFVQETLAEFCEHGADLHIDFKSRFKNLERELAKITQKFSENVLDSTNTYELVLDDELSLDGLPPLAKEAARLDALKKGYGTDKEPRWRFTLQYPSFSPAMKYLINDDIRKQLWEASIRIGNSKPYKNDDIIWKSLELREEKAKLLGKNNFPDLVLERRMTKNGNTALEFVNNLHRRIKLTFDKECEELEIFKAQKTGTLQEHLEPWEFAYWSEKLRRERYDFDEEDLRPYFSIDSVIKGMFSITEKIFGIKINEREVIYVNGEGCYNNFKLDTFPPWEKPIEVWHPEVKYYDIFGQNKRHLGSFYADWHPRESKRSGAWMNSFITGQINKSENRRDPHLGLICGNLTPSVNDKPALLTHNEVSTIFHEFGHLLHHTLGEVEIKSMNGTNVAWDFVELPSQIMENWCWERESLDLFARHYVTEEKIPNKLLDKMKRARNFQAASQIMRQLSFAKMDLELHMNCSQFSGGDLDAILNEMLVDYNPPSKTTTLSIIRRFTHLFANSLGYASGYYSYKWAEVLDADAFTRFKKEGVLNPKVGHEFRKHILSKGNAEDPSKLFKKFMGRDLDFNALLIRDGLA